MPSLNAQSKATSLSWWLNKAIVDLEVDIHSTKARKRLNELTYKVRSLNNSIEFSGISEETRAFLGKNGLKAEKLLKESYCLQHKKTTKAPELDTANQIAAGYYSGVGNAAAWVGSQLAKTDIPGVKNAGQWMVAQNIKDQKNLTDIGFNPKRRSAQFGQGLGEGLVSTAAFMGGGEILAPIAGVAKTAQWAPKIVTATKVIVNGFKIVGTTAAIVDTANNIRTGNAHGLGRDVGALPLFAKGLLKKFRPVAKVSNVPRLNAAQTIDEKNTALLLRIKNVTPVDLRALVNHVNGLTPEIYAETPQALRDAYYEGLKQYHVLPDVAEAMNHLGKLSKHTSAIVPVILVKAGALVKIPVVINTKPIVGIYNISLEILKKLAEDAGVKINNAFSEIVRKRHSDVDLHFIFKDFKAFYQGLKDLEKAEKLARLNGYTQYANSIKIVLDDAKNKSQNIARLENYATMSDDDNEIWYKGFHRNGNDKKTIDKIKAEKKWTLSARKITEIQEFVENNDMLNKPPVYDGFRVVKNSRVENEHTSPSDHYKKFEDFMRRFTLPEQFDKLIDMFYTSTANDDYKSVIKDIQFKKDAFILEKTLIQWRSNGFANNNRVYIPDHYHKEKWYQGFNFFGSNKKWIIQIKAEKKWTLSPIQIMDIEYFCKKNGWLIRPPFDDRDGDTIKIVSARYQQYLDFVKTFTTAEQYDKLIDVFYIPNAHPNYISFINDIAYKKNDFVKKRDKELRAFKRDQEIEERFVVQDRKQTEQTLWNGHIPPVLIPFMSAQKLQKLDKTLTKLDIIRINVVYAYFNTKPIHTNDEILEFISFYKKIIHFERNNRPYMFHFERSLAGPYVKLLNIDGLKKEDHALLELALMPVFPHLPGWEKINKLAIDLSLNEKEIYYLSEIGKNIQNKTLPLLERYIVFRSIETSNNARYGINETIFDKISHVKGYEKNKDTYNAEIVQIMREALGE